MALSHDLLISEEEMFCIYCRREIHEIDRRYYSRQAGMKGLYHWDCFVEACRKVNREGANELETFAVTESVLPVNNAYSYAGK